ncbi:hypothetical protein AVEN_127535-1 [Araneus ventricosus]|uniref:Uncharacterized protein n=1 Tax=Araneus ventricosus TaxID=182803 RepID=A0A4Y2HRF2_ARAVE|nr:hypothetical protein AVEN_127535-1 [Araneus ventricosus]
MPPERPGTSHRSKNWCFNFKINFMAKKSPQSSGGEMSSPPHPVRSQQMNPACNFRGGRNEPRSEYNTSLDDGSVSDTSIVILINAALKI